MLRIGRRSRIVGALCIAISCLTAGVWAWEQVASRDARQALRALAGGQFAAAEVPLARLLRAQPNSAMAHFLQGRLQLARGNLSGAKEGLNRARALGHPQPQLDLLQAMINARLGRHAEAEPILRQAFEDARGQTRSLTRRWLVSTWRRSTLSAPPVSSTALSAMHRRTRNLTSGGRRSIVGARVHPTRS